MTAPALVHEFVDDAIRQHSAGAGPIMSLTSEVRRRANAKGVPVDQDFWKEVLEYWWTLARSGAVALSGGAGDIVREGGTGGLPHPGLRSDVPEFVVTALGRRMLAEKSPSPHNWALYEAAVRFKVGTVDPVVMVHLWESVRAFHASLHRSSAVMLGCAVERLIILLAEAIVMAALPAPADKLGAKLANPRVGISDIYDDVRMVLDHAADDKKLNRDIADVLDRRLTALFDHARALRNKSGHPTGADVTADEALSGLLLFPGFYEFVTKVIKALPSPTAEVK